MPRPSPARGPVFSYGFSTGRNNGQITPWWDQHQDFEINFLEEGRLTYLFNGSEEAILAGQFVAFWGSVPHRVIRLEGVRNMTWVHVPMSWVLAWSLPEALLRAMLNGGIVREPHASERGPHDRDLARQWHEDIRRKDETLREAVLLEIQARLRRLFLAAPLPAPAPRSSGPRSETPPASRKALHMAGFIAEHYTEPLHVEQIANAVALTPEYAMTLFKREFGLTMTRFINQHRLWHAQRSLTTTREKILTIALDSGFGSLTQFNAVFKQVTATTPRAFRRSIQPTGTT
jgi:AraC-like DNA-binding protein